MRASSSAASAQARSAPAVSRCASRTATSPCAASRAASAAATAAAARSDSARARVERLDAGVLALDQLVVAAEVGLRAGGLRPGARERGLGLADARVLELELALGRGDRRRLGLQRGGRLVDAGAEVAVVEPGQDVAAAHRLVLGDLDRGDVARDLGADGREVGVDVGVVRRLQEAELGPPVPAAPCRRRQGEAEEGQRHALLHPGSAPAATATERSGQRARSSYQDHLNFQANSAAVPSFATGETRWRREPSPGSGRRQDRSARAALDQRRTRC